MTEEELQDLVISRDMCKTVLKSINLEIAAKKLELAELIAKWEGPYKEFVLLDRVIANATKVRVIKSTYEYKPPAAITPKTAREMLEALGVTVESKTSLEEPLIQDEERDLLDSIGTLEAIMEAEGE